MKNQSDWAVIRCDKCNIIFAVPNEIINEDGENYRNLICPCCGNDNINVSKNFISNQTMDIGVKKITQYIIEE